MIGVNRGCEMLPATLRADLFGNVRNDWESVTHTEYQSHELKFAALVDNI